MSEKYAQLWLYFARCSNWSQAEYDAQMLKNDLGLAQRERGCSI